jgi:hypothetical protein
MDNFEEKKLRLLNPLLFEAGAALFDCQHLEYGVALLLFHLARLSGSDLDVTFLSRLMDNKEKKTLGQLIRLLRQSAQVSPTTATSSS